MLYICTFLKVALIRVEKRKNHGQYVNNLFNAVWLKLLTVPFEAIWVLLLISVFISNGFPLMHTVYGRKECSAALHMQFLKHSPVNNY